MGPALQRFAILLGVIQGFALVGIVTLILTSVVLRNVFSFGLVWVFEAAGFLMVVLVFVGIPKNIIQKNDINVDFFTLMLPRTLQWLLAVFAMLIVLSVLIVFAFELFPHLQRFGGLATPTLKIPHWLYYGAVFVGPVIALPIVLWQLYELVFRGANDGRR
ncbi:MAG: TRAP transporter small permease subunit [Pseudomonadota bacterium]